MPIADLVPRGAQVLTVCNACRYCEQYCPVFPAIERRLTFEAADLAYLANLCHNCGECLYACQYAPPHEFGINVPRTLAEARLASYEEYAWPQALGSAFRSHSLATAIALAAGMSALLLAGTWLMNPAALSAPVAPGGFYSIVPHQVMVTMFGAVFVFALVALALGVRRFWRDIGGDSKTPLAAVLTAVRDALTVRHLHTDGVDCVSGEEQRAPWRRWFHHATFYGFALCFASTSVAAVYHIAFGWEAPYGYTSLPVLLGTAGGLGLLTGTTGLFALRARRDPNLGDPKQDGLGASFTVLLWLTAVTGLALLALREGPWMPWLLLPHLGIVLALFVTLPYGKFVHGLYRTAALVRSAAETARDSH